VSHTRNFGSAKIKSKSPTIRFMTSMDQYRMTGYDWAFLTKFGYHIPGIAARLYLTPIDQDVVHISDLKATFPGAGAGSRLLRIVAELADEAEVVLSLDAKSFGEIRIPDDKLVEWYKRFNFCEAAAETFDEGIPMTRLPCSARFIKSFELHWTDN
jgi:hypothetical protein